MEPFLALWPGTHILLVWGVDSLNAIRAQCNNASATPPKPQCENKYGIVLTSKKASTTNLFQLYGGEPVLVVNAQRYTYAEMSGLCNGTFTKRTIYVTTDVPYWHHSFNVQESPFGFDLSIPPRPTAEGGSNTFCCSCAQMKPCTAFVHETHAICSDCNWRIQNFYADGTDFWCYHASHRREYVDHDRDFIVNGIDLGTDGYYACGAEDCAFPVDEQVRCHQCYENGYCSAACLNKTHACVFTAPQ